MLSLAAGRVTAQLIAGQYIATVLLDLILHHWPCVADGTTRAIFRFFDADAVPPRPRPAMSIMHGVLGSGIAIIVPTAIVIALAKC
ncbi:MAG: hypothetical protein ACRYGK_00910 [Janthinobacterium lividum]